MADDPYAALGVSKTATDAEIKKAYRKIAKRDHPDLTDDPAAHERFKAASVAYDLLKDPEQRARFDRGEIDAQGQERPQRRYYRDFSEAPDNPYRGQADYGDFSDVFADLFGERGFRTRLLSAAFRNHMHWSQLVGGDVVISPPFEWQVRLNASGIEPLSRIDEPVAADVLETLYTRFPEFRRAYDTDGMTPAEFQDFGATRKTLRQFLAADAELEALVRDVLLPDPEK